MPQVIGLRLYQNQGDLNLSMGSDAAYSYYIVVIHGVGVYRG